MGRCTETVLQWALELTAPPFWSQNLQRTLLQRGSDNRLKLLLMLAQPTAQTSSLLRCSGNFARFNFAFLYSKLSNSVSFQESCLKTTFHPEGTDCKKSFVLRKKVLIIRDLMLTHFTPLFLSHLLSLALISLLPSTD